MSPRSVPALLVVALTLLAAGGTAHAGELDPATLAFKLPADFVWRDSTAYPGLKNAVLHGDPSKPGPYVVRNRFAPGTFSQPHFHPNDRFIVVVSGTWWIGTGEKFDPDSTKPMPAGSFVVHYGGKVHYDGAKQEECEILIYGMGPATSTRVGDK
jgi:quercetin dioxygenase-like cupin family protein